jgi:hypothetical protein
MNDKRKTARALHAAYIGAADSSRDDVFTGGKYFNDIAIVGGYPEDICEIAGTDSDSR